MIETDIPEYSYIINRYYRKTHRILSAEVYDSLFSFFNEDQKIHFLCSWFCEQDVINLNKMGFQNMFFYDSDKTVFDINNKNFNNVYHNDVIFDSLKLDGVFVNKYCEYTFPVGKVYRGEFILIGCDDDSLHICNPIKSNNQLIDQNDVLNVYYRKEWSVIREYDQKHLNYFMVVGCNN
jgi:hypothetical protein